MIVSSAAAFDGQQWRPPKAANNHSAKFAFAFFTLYTLYRTLNIKLAML